LAEARVAGKIEGTVESFGPAGNLITNITADQLLHVPRDQSVTIVCDEHETMGIFTPEHNEPAMTYLAVIGESGRLELTIVGDSARDMLGIARGTPVVVRW
jgi:S-adenosylmethionine hydrolase